MAKIIGIVGFIGSGKGSVGDILAERGFQKASFGQAIKDVAAVMFGWPRFLLEGDTDQSREFRETPCPIWSGLMGRPFTPREALQKIGTEGGRVLFHENFWVGSLNNTLDATKDYVITDVRFLNEIEMVRARNGVVIEIQRGENPPWYEPLSRLRDSQDRELFMGKHAPHLHESEWDWIGQPVDFVLKNTGTKMELASEVERVLQTVNWSARPVAQNLVPVMTRMGCRPTL